MARIEEAKRRIEEIIETKNSILKLNGLGLNGSEDVFKLLSEVTHITELFLNNNEITDIYFLKGLKQLCMLNLSNNKLENCPFLQNFNQLHTLNLSINKLKNYPFLKELKQLQLLKLSNSKLENISFFKELKQLRTLNLSNNKLKDISVLKELKQLRTLNLSNNNLKNISFFKELKQLHTLNLSNNKLKDISFFKELKQLRTLNLSNSKLKSIYFLKELKQLQTLNLRYNAITDITPLQTLKQLQLLDLSDNKISDISALEFLPNLKEISLKENPITVKQFIKENIRTKESVLKLDNLDLGSSEDALKLLSKATHITELHLTNNQISDISFLEGLKELHTLNLSYNEIENLSVLELLPNLKEVSLKGNPTNINITTIKTKSYINFKIGTKSPILKLNELGLDDLEDVLKSLRGATHITELHLTNNQISDISFLEELKELHTLNLSHNEIEDLSVLKELKQLQSLNLSSNKITNLSLYLSVINDLDLTDNPIQTFSVENIENYLLNLELLDLKIDSSVVTFRAKDLYLDGFLNLEGKGVKYNDRNIDKIEFRNCLVKSEQLKQLNIVELDLSNTKVTDYSFLLNFPNLITLNLSNHKLTGTASFIPLKKLEKLNLSNNHLTGISLHGFPSLKEINWEENSSLKTINLVDCEVLESLDISGLELEKIKLINLKKLEKLDLSNNQLEEIVLEQLDALNDLQIYGNPLQYFTLKGLKNLSKLDLSRMSFDTMSLEGLSTLKRLNLEGNKYEDLSFLKEFKQLEMLDLSNNPIADLGILTGLSKLKSLYLTKNKLENVSLKQLNKFPNLETLVLKGNPIKNIPKEFFDNSSINVLDGVKDYLQAQAEGQIINITSKLILFGNGEAGKTTLSHQLRRNKFEQYDERTHGILVKEWTIKAEDFSDDLKEKLNQIYKEIKQDEPKSLVEMPKEITLDLWDFGGQEYYHATHRLFLTNNVLYLLVWDRETNQQVEIEDDLYYPLGYWRENIKNNASKSRILEIQNKVKGKYDIDHENLKYKVNFRDKNNEKSLKRYETDIEDLKEGIFNQLHHLEHLGSGFPKVYDDIRQALSEKEAPFLSFTEYTKLCQDTDQTKKKIMQEGSQVETLTKFLHDTGAIICYRFNEKKHKNIERLKNYVFIKPTWVTDAIYAIFSKKVKKENGEFKFKHIRKSLKNHADKLKKKGEEFPKLAPKVWLELLNAFELVFENEKKSSFIVPQYLPLECPNTGLVRIASNSTKHCFTLYFPNYLAKSLFLRFISQFGTQHVNDLYWKNGLVFIWESKTVSSSCDYEARKISIEVQDGDEAVTRDMLSFFLDKINQDTLISLSETEKKVNLEKLQEKVDLGKQEIEDTEGNTLDVKDFEHLFKKQDTMEKIKIFVSYSSDDRKLRQIIEKKLSKHLKTCKNEYDPIWTDAEITTGGDWNKTIQTALEKSNMGLLLVSQMFLASDYAQEEFNTMLEKSKTENYIIIPILLRDCNFTNDEELKATQFFKTYQNEYGVTDMLKEDELMPFSDLVDMADIDKRRSCIDKYFLKLVNEIENSVNKKV